MHKPKLHIFGQLTEMNLTTYRDEFNNLVFQFFGQSFNDKNQKLGYLKFGNSNSKIQMSQKLNTLVINLIYSSSKSEIHRDIHISSQTSILLT